MTIKSAPLLKSILFIPALWLIWGPLSGQPQILPPVEIGSDAAVKAPLLKKQLSFPEEVPADSLPSFIPRKLDLEHIPTPRAGKTLRPLHLFLSGDTSRKADLILNIHPASDHIPLAGFEAGIKKPGGDHSFLDLGTHIQTRFSKSFSLLHNILYQESAADSFASAAIGYEISNFTQSIGLGASLFRDLRTHLRLEGHEQEIGSADYPDLSFGFTHSHNFSWKWIGLENEFIWQEDDQGLAIKFRVPETMLKSADAGIGLMTDLNHVLPAVDLHKRLELAPRLYLELSNVSSITSWSHKELVNDRPWSALPDDIPLSLKPLDLSLRAFKIFQTEGLLQLASLSHNSSFTMDQAILKTLPGGDGTAVFFQDRMVNYTSLDLHFNLWGLMLEQSLGLDLSRLPEENWATLPYSPLFTVTTSFGRSWERFSCGAGIDQHYHIEDDTGNELPSIIDLNLGLEYQLSKDFSLEASLSNLLDHQYRDYGSLPRSGREFSLSLRYLPLRHDP